MENTERVVKTTKKVKGQLPPFAQKMPEHYTNLVRIIKNNAEIKRFTSLGIINWLTQKGVINGKSKYVDFKWNKFTVITDGWKRDFSYKEPFFINCLVASFSCFANSATKAIEDFVSKEIEHKEEITQEAANEIRENLKSRILPVEEEHTETESASDSFDTASDNESLDNE